MAHHDPHRPRAAAGRMSKRRAQPASIDGTTTSPRPNASVGRPWVGALIARPMADQLSRSEAARRFTLGDLGRAFDTLAETDLLLKGSKIPGDVALQRAVLELDRLGGEGGGGRPVVIRLVSRDLHGVLARNSAGSSSFAFCHLWQF